MGKALKTQRRESGCRGTSSEVRGDETAGEKAQLQCWVGSFPGGQSSMMPPGVSVLRSELVEEGPRESVWPLLPP